jgi:pyrimidine operon attenuation protein/uracil phosphoribosyltransferase
MSSKLILDNTQIAQKIKRMAYEIYENNFEAKELTLIGIQKHGYKLTESLLKELKAIFKIKYEVIPVVLDKKNPVSFAPDFSEQNENIKGKTVILIDDVLNSGRTLMYAIKPILELEPKSLQVAVLINRDHKNFPVHPDFTGLSLATTIQEHVEVTLNKKGEYSAYLK